MPRHQGTFRVTLDLSRELHRELKTWLRRAAHEAGVANVPMAVVLRWLVATLVADSKRDERSLLSSELHRAVLEHLRDEEARA